jgi:hypothetical protein
MLQVEVIYFIVGAIIILGTPFVPTDLLLLLDNIVARAAAIFLLLYLITVGPAVSIIALMALCLLYMERNRRKVSIAARKIDKMDYSLPEYATVEEAGRPQKTVPVNEFDKPNPTQTRAIPQEEPCDITNFEPVAPTINEKSVLSSIYPLNKDAPESGSAADELFEKLGFGHVMGVETMGDN